jgi:predicted lipoprotein
MAFNFTGAKMATRSRASWGLVGGLALVALARAGCIPDEKEPPVDPELQAVLADTWPQVLEPALADASNAIGALDVACQAWADSGGEPERVAAQEAWRDAMAAWEQVEVLQLGPLASSLSAVGGEDLRDEIYSWPTVNACAVDLETLGEAWRAPDFTATHLVNVYGLDALENLLFAPPGATACPPDTGLDPSGLDALRPAYAAALSGALIAAVEEAKSAEESFAPDFAAAGTADSSIDSATLALNAIFDALYYLETRVKDDKLGGPLGLYDCGGACNPVETPQAGGSNEWIAANLVGFRALFTGGDGQGLDDLLDAADRSDIADAMITALDAADQAAAALTVPVEVAAATDPAPAVALHAAVTEVGEILQSDVAPALTLQIPSEAAGDND